MGTWPMQLSGEQENQTQNMEDVERLRTSEKGGLIEAAVGGLPQRAVNFEGEHTFARSEQVSLLGATRLSVI